MPIPTDPLRNCVFDPLYELITKFPIGSSATEPCFSLALPEINKISEMITIYNKIDIKGSKSSYQYKKNYINALTGEGDSDLKKTLKNSLI